MRGNGTLFGLGSIVGMIMVIGAAAGACSATGDDTFGGQGAGKTSSGNGGAGNSPSGGDGGLFIPSAASGSSGLGGGSCAATANKGEQVPLGMYLMVDQSGSMGATTSGNRTRWDDVSDALKSFVDQPTAAGIGVGIQYFPTDSGTTMMCGLTCFQDSDCGAPGCGPCEPPPIPFPGVPGTCAGGTSGGSCNVAIYEKPEVTIANLPGIAPVIKSSIDNHGPTGGTPTGPALDGAIKYTQSWMTANPQAVGVVVLATDGYPEGCSSNQDSIDYVKGIAAAGLKGVPSVKTYVIGVGSLLTNLEAIAVAGGTGKAFLVDTGANAQADFLQAMNSIRGSALSCAYLIPQPPANEMINYNAINVQYTPEGGKPEVIPQVSVPAGCPTDGTKAWHYDSSVPPTQILLCPSTCDAIKADSKGQIDVLVGCATVIK